MTRLAALAARIRRCWAASCLRTHIAQLEAVLFRPDLWPSDDPVVSALYCARLAELRAELAALEQREAMA